MTGLLHDVALADRNGQLVDIDAHAVTEAVAIVVAVAGIADDLLREQVDIMAVDARVNRADALLVRATDEVVELALLSARLAENDRSGHVRTIVAVARTVIEQHEVALLHDAVGGDGVRVRGVGTEATMESKAKGIRTVAEHEALELGADLLLGKAGANELAHMGERGIGDGLRMAHELDLLGILDSAHELDVAVHQGQERADGEVLEPALYTAVEADLDIILDGDDTALGIAGAMCDQRGISMESISSDQESPSGRFSSNALK